MNETGSNESKIQRRRKELVQIDVEIGNLRVRRAGLQAEVDELRRGAPPASAHEGMSITEQILRHIESQDSPVAVQAVVAHLDAEGICSDSSRVSAILGRHAAPGGRVRRVGRGLFEGVGVGV